MAHMVLNSDPTSATFEAVLTLGKSFNPPKWKSFTLLN